MRQLDGNAIVDTKMQIISRADGSVFANVYQAVDGVSQTYDEVVQISEGSVREGLSVASLEEDLNQAESLIVHAMWISRDPELGGIYSAGIDLDKVRSAKIFTVGKSTKMGSAAIIEARDGSNKVLGSFLGGFVVSPCQ